MVCMPFSPILVRLFLGIRISPSIDSTISNESFSQQICIFHELCSVMELQTRRHCLRAGLLLFSWRTDNLTIIRWISIEIQCRYSFAMNVLATLFISGSNIASLKELEQSLIRWTVLLYLLCWVDHGEASWNINGTPLIWGSFKKRVQANRKYIFWTIFQWDNIR